MLLVAGLLAYSAWAVPPAWYVPVSLVLGVVLVVGALRSGLSASDLGFARDRVPAGLRLGLMVAGVVATVLVVGVALPITRPLFDDDRVADIGIGLLLYRTLIRIPLGTALLEEVAFRGVLLAEWRRRASPRSAVIGSSAVFGLWHIRPAMDLLEANDLGGGFATVLVVAGAVALTFVAGLFLCWLRLRSNSLVAPWVAHVAINSLATVAAFVVA